PGAQGRQPGGGPGGPGENAVGRAGGGPAELGGGGRADPGRVEAGQLDGGGGQLVPGAGPLVGDMEHPGPALDRQPGQGAGQVGGVGGAAALVVDDPQRRTLPGPADDRVDEVAAPAAEHPRGAGDGPGAGVAGDLPLPAELRAAVDGPGAGLVPLVVGPVLVAGEDVVGGDVHQVGAHPGAG